MIPRIPTLTREALAERFMRPGLPVVLTRQMDAWGALRWTPEGLKERVASVVLQVQEGNMEQEATVLGEARLHDYLDEILRPESEGPRKYMAQFDLLEAFPGLAKDLRFAELFPAGRLLYPFGWIGPAGTVTGLHKDDSHNALAQLYGRKRVLLLSPRNDPFVYPSRKYDYGARLSYVDAEAPDHARYPLFRSVEKEEVVLAPGELLFIPVGWWHQVRSLDPSISVSCFAQSYREYLMTTPETVRWCLHQLRLLGVREGCTCHPEAWSRAVRGEGP
jgi:Cupin-like domain